MKLFGVFFKSNIQLNNQIDAFFASINYYIISIFFTFFYNIVLFYNKSSTNSREINTDKI
jgi:hypothetical protein